MSRILVTSTQYPYYGGAATNSYALIKYLRKHGHKVGGIFFENKNVNVDPDNISAVWRHHGDSNYDNVIRRFSKAYLGGEPEIILGKNYAAPPMSKNIFPNSKIVYLVTGSPIMMDLSKKNISCIKYLSSNGKAKRFAPEKKCIDLSDIIVPNSPLARKMLLKNYGHLKKISKAIDTSLAFNYNIKNDLPHSNRKYDVAFVCSNMSREVKNSSLALKIYKDPKIIKRKKIAIGGNSKMFSNTNLTLVKGMSSQKEIIKLFKNTKVVICTSYYDASPNVIKEALMCGCNILVSKNCGWSTTYPKEFVCKDVYDKAEWVNKLNYLVDNKILYKPHFSSSLLAKEINEVIGGK
jgi:glycosyltransferase involved in cell wall biosynthesis